MGVVLRRPWGAVRRSRRFRFGSALEAVLGKWVWVIVSLRKAGTPPSRNDLIARKRTAWRILSQYEARARSGLESEAHNV